MLIGNWFTFVLNAFSQFKEIFAIECAKGAEPSIQTGERKKKKNIS